MSMEVIFVVVNKMLLVLIFFFFLCVCKIIKIVKLCLIMSKKIIIYLIINMLQLIVFVKNVLLYKCEYLF